MAARANHWARETERKTARLHGSLCSRAGWQVYERSEIQLGSKLKDSWIEGTCHLAKIARSECIADLVELSVVPRVEAFRAEFEPAATSFVEHKALEQREVPVVAARATQ